MNHGVYMSINKNARSEKKNLRFEHDLIKKIKSLDTNDNFSKWVKDACWQRIQLEENINNVCN